MSTEEGIQSTIQIFNNLTNYHLQKKNKKKKPMGGGTSILKFYFIAISAAQQLKSESSSFNPEF